MHEKINRMEGIITKNGEKKSNKSKKNDSLLGDCNYDNFIYHDNNHIGC